MCVFNDQQQRKELYLTEEFDCLVNFKTVWH
jgi:hypothetical protein